MEKANATFSISKETLQKLHKYSYFLMLNKSLYVEKAIKRQMEADREEYNREIENQIGNI